MPAKRRRLPAAELKDTRGFAKRSSQYFIVRSRVNGLPHSRFAAIVGAKVDKSSVGRHLLKRRIAESLQPMKDNRDIVVTVLPAAKELPRKQFLQELEKVIK
jgi:ribonuclease P protein component